MTMHTTEPAYLVPDQTRRGPLTPYDDKLATAIRSVFGCGIHDLRGLVEGLNDAGIHAPDGTPWTAETFTAEMSVKGA